MAAALFSSCYVPRQAALVIAKLSTGELEAMAHEFMLVLDPENKIPFPAIRIVKRTGVDWDGIIYTQTYRDAQGVGRAVTGRIDIQAHIVDSETSSRRIVAHECCQLVQYWNIAVGLSPEQSEENFKKNGGHKQGFLAQAARINAVYGPDFVTPKSDSSYERGTRPLTYFLLLKGGTDPRLKFCTSARPSPDQIRFIRKMYMTYGPGSIYGEARLVRAPEIEGFHGVNTMGHGWNRVIEPDSNQKLEALWDKGENLLDAFAHKDTVIPFWVVMQGSRSGEFIDFWATRTLTPRLKKKIENAVSVGQTVKIYRSDNEQLLQALPVFGRDQGMLSRRVERLGIEGVDAHQMWDSGTPQTAGYQVAS